jgi:hypothetical protein
MATIPSNELWKLFEDTAAQICRQWHTVDRDDGQILFFLE